MTRMRQLYRIQEKQKYPLQPVLQSSMRPPRLIKNLTQKVSTITIMSAVQLIPKKIAAQILLR